MIPAPVDYVAGSHERPPHPTPLPRGRGSLARLAAAFAILCGALSPAAAQDMLRHLDMQSPAMTQAEMTRAEIESLLKSQAGRPLDLSSKALNGLDLSGLDLSHAILRNARLNKASLKGAKLEGAVLDQAWGIGANFSGANLKGASLFASQFQGANFDGADLSGARITADLSRASLKGANLAGANGSADLKNQSMGLMTGVFKSADLTGREPVERKSIPGEPGVREIARRKPFRREPDRSRCRRRRLPRRGHGWRQLDRARHQFGADRQTNSKVRLCLRQERGGGD